mmetsp:Transcript_31909/g.84396  ORF Transcript_31909/g.84396 Transcript_31909/m.84396 type:complete len:306 (+) Transcript_31909:574-1491(+)
MASKPKSSKPPEISACGRANETTSYASGALSNPSRGICSVWLHNKGDSSPRQPTTSWSSTDRSITHLSLSVGSGTVSGAVWRALAIVMGSVMASLAPVATTGSVPYEKPPHQVVSSNSPVTSSCWISRSMSQTAPARLSSIWTSGAWKVSLLRKASWCDESGDSCSSNSQKLSGVWMSASSCCILRSRPHCSASVASETSRRGVVRKAPFGCCEGRPPCPHVCPDIASIFALASSRFSWELRVPTSCNLSPLSVLSRASILSCASSAASRASAAEGPRDRTSCICSSALLSCSLCAACSTMTDLS